MILCKPCYQDKYNSWKKPFDENASMLLATPDYNELTQHVHLFDVNNIALTLQNEEMLEISCEVCKLQYIGKNSNGDTKVKYYDVNSESGVTDWQDYTI
jgi:hypothetical protein